MSISRRRVTRWISMQGPCSVDPGDRYFPPFVVGRDVPGVERQRGVNREIEIALRSTAGANGIDEILELAPVAQAPALVRRGRDPAFVRTDLLHQVKIFKLLVLRI